MSGVRTLASRTSRKPEGQQETQGTTGIADLEGYKVSLSLRSRLLTIHFNTIF